MGGLAGSVSYVLVPSVFGVLGLVWRESADGPRVQRVLLPEAETPTAERVRALEPDARPGSWPAMVELAGQMARFLDGEDLVFPTEVLGMEACSAFQQRVLRAEHAIPRGWVSSYGRIAAHVGAPGAARAVGHALASNPFPILIPCHRAIRGDGGLGGYQGGLAMKRALLQMEGLRVSAAGKVLTSRFCY